MRAWIKARLREPSTWRGLAALATATGVVVVPPELVDQVIAVGLGVIGTVNVARSERH